MIPEESEVLEQGWLALEPALEEVLEDSILMTRQERDVFRRYVSAMRRLFGQDSGQSSSTSAKKSCAPFATSGNNAVPAFCRRKGNAARVRHELERVRR